MGSDKSAQHLAIFANGKYGCAVDNSPEHSRAIYALLGTDGSGHVGSLTGAPEPEPTVEMERVWPAELLDRLIRDHSYWEGRGISEATVAPFRGGVATSAQMADRYVLPQFNEHGEIIGFSGRCLRTMSDADRKRFNRPKWKHLSSSSRFVWGGLDEIEDCRRAVLVESIGDSLALREHGVPESAVLFGTALSQALLGWLIAADPQEIIVSTNLDTPKLINGVMRRPGQDAAIRIHRALTQFFSAEAVRIVHPPQGVKDWNEATAGQIGEAFAPADCLIECETDEIEA